LGLDGVVLSHDQVCKKLLRHCTNPQAEVLEYLKRDVAECENYGKLRSVIGVFILDFSLFRR
jgi:hypothetical protein